ncbi:helix-turn-helix transcriptional regulator [Caballeronia sp. LjRoot31]|uniref:helix-turn-helix transcriptional regulator n=1 Tax=Caballeronia sp. LjRoot31 TaxID=3342324 RepID=UPI003ECECDAC
MAVRFVNAADRQTAQSAEIPPVVNSRADVSHIDLSLPGRLRAAEVQAILRIGPTWHYKGVKTGLYPAPDYYEGKLRFWRHSTIRKFLESGGDA